MSSTVSFEEFSKLPKKKATKNLIPGKQYYIQDAYIQGARKEQNYRKTTVFTGTFVKKYDSDINGDIKKMCEFKDVQFLVAPFGAPFGTGGRPQGFNEKKHTFMEIIRTTPTESDILNKRGNLDELQTFISEKKGEPHDEIPSVSFFGKDYRKAKKRFKKQSMKQSKQRLSEKLSMKKKGGTRKKK